MIVAYVLIHLTTQYANNQEKQFTRDQINKTQKSPHSQKK